MQSPQTSTLQTGESAQSGSAQSTRPSPSLSMPSLQFSGGFDEQPGIGVEEQAPATQVSVVHGLPSLQSASAAQAVQPGTTVAAQAPATQVSVVHALPSSQSASVAQGVQAGARETVQAPAEHDAVVQ